MLSTTNKYQVDVILHIGKTGGTFIRGALRRMAADPDRVRLLPHSWTAQQALQEIQGCRIVFSLRDPISLFISGFNSRLRHGEPLYDSEWSAGEAAAFRRYRTPDTLARTIYVRADAAAAMREILHVREGLRHYLHSVEFLQQNRDRIGFILDQPNLDRDIRRYAESLGLDTAPLAAARISQHETPLGFTKKLSDLGRENLLRWYAEDHQIYQWCMRNKAQINGG